MTFPAAHPCLRSGNRVHPSQTGQPNANEKRSTSAEIITIAEIAAPRARVTKLGRLKQYEAAPGFARVNVVNIVHFPEQAGYDRAAHQNG